MKFVKLLPFFALSLIFAGCTGYQMGSNLPESVQTVSLSIVNGTEEPSIEVQTMKALRAEVQMDGRLSLRSESEADAVLKVTLTGYNLHALAYDREHNTLASEYRVVLTASAVLYDAATGDVLREIPSVAGESEFPYAADLTTGKSAALPSAADDLARKVVSMTIAAW
ncbi:MAG: LptE family protein [Verrucomicrobia bacterium]|nr:LptE family protein [Verrucomicrobiota bacterium]